MQKKGPSLEKDGFPIIKHLIREAHKPMINLSYQKTHGMK